MFCGTRHVLFAEINRGNGPLAHKGRFRPKQWIRPADLCLICGSERRNLPGEEACSPVEGVGGAVEEMTGQTTVDIPETGAIFTFGRSSFNRNVPSKFWLKNDRPVHVSCGGGHSAVVTENGRLVMFGSNSNGQLGLGIKPAANKPASVKAFKSEKVKIVACGRDHTIICTYGDSVYGAGSNQEGQLGLGHCSDTSSFHQLRPFCAGAPIKMLAAGCNTSAALTEDGRVFMWGDNSVGQIGLGVEGFAAEPREVDVGEAVAWVSCGYHHSALVTVNGHLYTFGESANGRLGLREEQLSNHRVPQLVQGIVGRVSQACCGGEHTVALTASDVYTFGRGQYGQLGQGTFLFELDFPKALDHFCNSSVKHVACGVNHTAVITHHGLLYTFGDGRHGKLGSGEENFTNQFSPTLCTHFQQYDVKAVSCGGHHMLAVAAPRPPQGHDGVPDDDVLISDCVLGPSLTDILWKETLIEPSSLASAASARARRRERESSVQLFREAFQSLPRLHSDFLNAPWQTSRNIRSSKNISMSPSSPKPQSEATASPLLSPRSRSISPRSPALSSKPSSPRSRSSRLSKASSSKSSLKEVPSPLLSPKSATKFNPNVASCEKKSTSKRLFSVGTSKGALRDKVSSSSSPKKQRSPAGTPADTTHKNLTQRTDTASLQSGSQTPQKQTVAEDVGEEALDPNTEKKKTTRMTKEAFSEQINGMTDQNYILALPTQLLKNSSSFDTEASPKKNTKKNRKVTSEGKENITESKQMPTPKDKMKLSYFKVPQQDDSTKTQVSVQKRSADAQQTRNDGKRKSRKNKKLEDGNVNLENIKGMDPAKGDTTKTPTSHTQSPVIKVTRGNETTQLISTENSAKEGDVDHSESSDINTAEERMQQETMQIESTLMKDLHKSESHKGQSTVDFKSPTTPVTTPSEERRKSASVKSTPVRSRGTSPELTAVKDRSAANTPAEGKIKEKGEENRFIRAKNKTPQNKSGGGGMRESKVKDKKEAKESDREMKTKREGVGADKKKAAFKKGDDHCRPFSSQQEPRLPKNQNSPPGPMRAVNQRAQHVDSNICETTNAENIHSPSEEKSEWGGALSHVACVLPAVGMAGAAIEVLRDAVTGEDALQSDVDKASPAPSKRAGRMRQFAKQSAISSPALSGSSSTEASSELQASTKTGAQIGIQSESALEEESNNATRDPSGREAARSLASEQIRGEDMEAGSEDEEAHNAPKENMDNKSDQTDAEDEERRRADEEESAGDVEGEGSEKTSGKDAEKVSASGDSEEEEENESEEEEGEEGTNILEEDENNKSDAADVEEEEEESSEASSGGKTGSAASEMEEGESEEENDEEEEESEVNGDEEGCFDESETADSKVEGEEEEEEEEEGEDGQGNDTAASEDRDSNDDEDHDEENNRDADEKEKSNVEKEKEEESEKSENEEDDDNSEACEKEDEKNEEEESEEEDSTQDMEEAGDEDAGKESDKEEADEGAEQDEDEEEDEEGAEEDDSNVEEAEEDEEEENEEEEAEEEDEGEDSEDEEADKDEEKGSEEGEVEEDEGEESGEEEDDEEEESEGEEEEEEIEEGEAEEDEGEGSEEEEAEEEDEGEEDEEEAEEESEEGEAEEDEEEGSEEEEAEEEDEGEENEEEAEEDGEEDEGEEDEEEAEEEDEEDEDEDSNIQKRPKQAGSESIAEEEEGEEDEEEEDEEDEDEDSNIQKRPKQAGSESIAEEEEGEEEEEEEDEEDEDLNIQKQPKRAGSESSAEEEEGEEDEEEEDEEDEDEDSNIQKQPKRAGSESSAEEEEGEEDEQEEEEEDEEEEEKVKPDKAEQQDKQRSALRAVPVDGRSEAPRPAPRTRQRPAAQSAADGPQQFWNDVLPQYLDLQ